MTVFTRTFADITNFEGAPGVNVYHFESLDQAAAGNVPVLLHNAYESVKAYLLPGLHVDIRTEILEIDPATGLLRSVITGDLTPQTVGSGTGSGVSRATQAVVRHNTDLISDQGKRVNGRSFIGPIAAGSLDNSGHIAATALAAFGAMFDGLQDTNGDSRLMVWHRPKQNEQGVVISPGAGGHVQDSVCLVKPGVMRSRRD